MPALGRGRKRVLKDAGAAFGGQAYTGTEFPRDESLRRLTLNSFRRVTKSGAFIPEIDGLRFIAIASVVLLHCYAGQLDRMVRGTNLSQTIPGAAPPPVDVFNPHGFFRLLGHGGYGVCIFFAISGFILAWPFAQQHLLASRKVALGSYFLRRLTRLELPYVAMLAIRAVLLLAAGIYDTRFVLAHLAASILYVHNIVFGIASRIEAVSWSLEIEVEFYCLAPALAVIYKIPRAWLRRALLIAIIGSATPLQRAFLPGWHGSQIAGGFNLSILAYIQFFLVGFLIADFYVDGWERIPRAWWWDAISIPLWLILFWLRLDAFRFLGPLILPILFVGAFKGTFIRAILRNPVINTIGGMCYSIYLTHRTTILVVQLLLVRLHFGFLFWLVLSLVVVAPISVAVGAVYFLLIERPCMDPHWPNKLIALLRSGRRSPIQVAAPREFPPAPGGGKPQDL
jgi:peptidoglycan/LPS O-acetylase OafA/YrhL